MSTPSATNEGSLWGARFASGPAPELAALSRSTHFDWQLAGYDLRGSRAHAAALEKAGYLTSVELERMIAAIDELDAAVVSGEFTALDSDEDVHGALERGLIEIAGAELGGRLPLAAAATTRSRPSFGSTCSTTPRRSRTCS